MSKRDGKFTPSQLPLNLSLTNIKEMLLLIANDNIIDDISKNAKLVRKKNLITNFILFASS